MVAVLDSDSQASPSKRRRLENLVQDLASSATTDSDSAGSIRVKTESDISGDVMGFHHDIFNTDNDRQELIGYCEKMLEECKNPMSHQDHPTGTDLTSSKRRAETTSKDPTVDELDNLYDIDPTDLYGSSFDMHDALEDQQLKSAYYFDGERFVSIQVIVDPHSGECQLILPLDHPHHLGVPEEVPIFETKSVPVQELKQ